ncbi:hypothetical protein FKM82_002121 [Ascaphus truei]
MCLCIGVGAWVWHPMGREVGASVSLKVVVRIWSGKSVHLARIWGLIKVDMNSVQFKAQLVVVCILYLFELNFQLP